MKTTPNKNIQPPKYQMVSEGYNPCDPEIVRYNSTVPDVQSLQEKNAELAEALEMSRAGEQQLRELLVEARGYLDRLTQEGIRNRIDTALAQYHTEE